MAVQPTPYDLANLQQITQAGQPLVDYLNQKQRIEETQRQEAARLSGEQTLLAQHNAFTGQQAELNRQNAIKVVEAQERARVRAARTAATSRLEARYPRKGGESDDDYMERIGKLQAQGPNKAYKQMRAITSGADKKGQDLETEIQQAMAGEEQRRRPFVEAKARQDADLQAAFSAAGSKTVPTNVPKAIEALRREPGGAAKAELLDSAWQSAIATADDPKKVPYSVELGDKIKGLRNKIQSVNMDAQRDAALLNQQAKILIDDPNFIGGPHLDFGVDEVGAAPPPTGGGGGKLPANATGRTAILQSYTPTVAPTDGTSTGFPVPGGALPAPVSPLLSPRMPVERAGLRNRELFPTVPGAGLVPANVNPLIEGINSGVKSFEDEAAGRIFQGASMIQRGQDAVSGLFNRGKELLFTGTPQQVSDQKVRQLFGNDAPALLIKAKALATSRGMSEEDQRANFDRALAGDPQAVAGVKRVLDYLRQERSNPSESMLTPTAAPYPTATPEDLLLPQ